MNLAYYLNNSVTGISFFHTLIAFQYLNTIVQRLNTVVQWIKRKRSIASFNPAVASGEKQSH